MSQLIPEGAMQEFISECEEILHRVGGTFTQSDHRSLTDHEIDSLYRDIHTLKGSAFLFGLRRIGLITHALEAYLGLVRDKKITLEKQLLDYIFKTLDFIEKILKNPMQDLENHAEIDIEFNALLPRLISACVNKLGGEFLLMDSHYFVENLNKDNLIEFKAEVKSSPIESEKINEVLEIKIPKKEIKKVVEIEKIIPQEIKKVVQMDIEKNDVEKIDNEKNQIKEGSAQEASTVRVHVGLLDKLMNLVGEMVLTRNQVLEFAKTSESNDF